ncbi:MAG: NADH-quinone oxidoreductase subunit NuoE [Magnetococcales bacterium]|nr:NADH-quinone oxidoreductase subunit NuoE [Magnetococcales bacterium]
MSNETKQQASYRGSHVQIVDDENTYVWPKKVQPEIKKLIAKYPKGREASAVIPLLKIAQNTFDGWLPTGLMNLVAETLSMPPVRVYEVARFYDMFYTKPVGKHIVRVCTNVSCMVRGCYKVLSEIEDELGMKAGTTSEDGLVTLEEFECLGACCEAPMMMIDDHYHTSLTGDKARELMKRIKDGDAPAEATK